MEICLGWLEIALESLETPLGRLEENLESLEGKLRWLETGRGWLEVTLGSDATVRRRVGATVAGCAFFVVRGLAADDWAGVASYRDFASPFGLRSAQALSFVESRVATG